MPEKAIKFKRCAEDSIGGKNEKGFIDEWVEKGRILLGNAELDESIEYFDKALELNANHGACLFYKGVALSYRMQNCKESIECFDKLLEINPTHSEAYFFLGKCYINSATFDTDDVDTKIYKLEKSLYYLNEAQRYSIDSEYDVKFYINNCQDKLNKLKHPEIEIRNNPEKIKEVQTKISNLKSKIKILTKELSEKFSETGQITYPQYMENASNLAPNSKAKLGEILAIDTLINKTEQDMENSKNSPKRTGFLAKLGDTIASTAKQGKLKLDLYNFERKKDSAITDFGEALWASHKCGHDTTLQELSDIWQEIDDIEQQIRENEEEIDNLNELLR